VGEIASLGLLEEQGRQTTLGLLGLFMTAGVWYPLQSRRMPNTLALGDGSECWVTAHPSSILRAPDEDAREEGKRLFLRDLKRIKARAEELAR